MTSGPEKSPHGDRSFCEKGKQPVEHRETAEASLVCRLTPADLYKPMPLRIQECGDLLREWGIRP